MSMQFTVPDMCCNGCVKSITKIVQSLDSDAKVEADLSIKKLSIETQASKDKVVAALEKGGFPPE
ncbi:heavy-metal-associated domain-containing protein [Microvirga sp. W0021]|uniref:Heavy-metal-associated domain-containing protein n=1 Tax=Hohaiivirga grylli TaxID=3133970 RepID=A0ABV0BIG4_9HYPH